MFCEMKTCIHIYNNVFGAIFDTYMKPSAKTPDQPEVTSLEAVDRTECKQWRRPMQMNSCQMILIWN